MTRQIDPNKPHARLSKAQLQGLLQRELKRPADQFERWCGLDPTATPRSPLTRHLGRQLRERTWRTATRAQLESFTNAIIPIHHAQARERATLRAALLSADFSPGAIARRTGQPPPATAERNPSQPEILAATNADLVLLCLRFGLFSGQRTRPNRAPRKPAARQQELAWETAAPRNP